jgi:hypothetical protein
MQRNNPVVRLDIFDEMSVVNQLQYECSVKGGRRQQFVVIFPP